MTPHVGAWCVALLIALYAPCSAAKEFSIQRVVGVVQSDYYHLDADATITLSAEIEEAVTSGVPLEFSFDVALCKPRKFLWDSCSLKLRRRFRLVRHALANSYVVTDLTAERTITSISLADALHELGQLRKISVGDADSLSSASPLLGRLRGQLDIEALPAPLRPIAYLSPSWRLKSRWYRWEVAL
jgi:hypothetical protein